MGTLGLRSLESGFTAGLAGGPGIYLTVVNTVSSAAGGHRGKLGGGHEGTEHSGPDYGEHEIGGEAPHGFKNAITLDSDQT